MGDFIAKFKDNDSATFNANFEDNNSATFKANFGASQVVIPGLVDYIEQVYNKPSLNGTTIVGDLTNEDLNIVNDKHYEFRQLTPSDRWEVEHNLDKYPAVSIVDSAGTAVVGEIEYINPNKVILLFQGAFTGKAFFN